MLSKENFVAGVDEVEGPLAGPVVAGAVVLPENMRLKVLWTQKTHQRKRNLSNYLSQSIRNGIGIVSVQKIDEINIREAHFWQWKGL